MRGIGSRRIALTLMAAALPLTASCSLFTATRVDSPQKAYVAGDDGGVLSRHAPVFVLQTYGPKCNRIGAAAARIDERGQERVFIDTERPVIYAQEEPFTTERGSYANLIYRVHFPEVPMPHLSAGRNVGLMVVLTLDSARRPVLITTVHTDGGYLAFVPTSFLPRKARPGGWETGGQRVHGEKLPGLLRLPDPYSHDYRAVVFLRDETHRVTDVLVQDVREATWRYDVVPAEVAPMASLEALPLGLATTSFFHESGLRRGYVKGSHKVLKTLLTGWWAMDLRVGSDKRYGDRRETGTVFYTSLKFWNREESDMWPFARFLEFWGWRL